MMHPRRPALTLQLSDKNMETPLYILKNTQRPEKPPRLFSSCVSRVFVCCENVHKKKLHKLYKLSALYVLTRM